MLNPARLLTLSSSSPTAGGSVCEPPGAIVSRTVDASFDPDASSAVRVIALEADDQILIGGSFTSMSGTTRNRLARVSSSGTLDSAFDPDVRSTIQALVVQSDRKIVFGGSFFTVGSTARNRLARVS